MINIKRVNNGFIITSKDLSEMNAEIEIETVFESGEEDEKKCLADVLYFIAQEFGYSYDKWKEDNLNITWDKKGHKID